MTARPDYSNRGLCAVYALVEDPDYFLFDADLFDADLSEPDMGPVVGHPSEYIPVAVVKLEPGAVEISYSYETLRYELGCDKGHFSAQQVVCGDAGEAVEVGLLLQEPNE